MTLTFGRAIYESSVVDIVYHSQADPGSLVLFAQALGVASKSGQAFCRKLMWEQVFS
jgi:hypothetical protein